MLLKIQNLWVEVEKKPVLKGLHLEVEEGSLHVIMGPNGSGKSTLSKVIAGHPDYRVTDGEIRYQVDGKEFSLLDLSASERAMRGIFLGFQSPVEIPGVTNEQFLKESYRAILEAQGAAPLEDDQFMKLLRGYLKKLDMREEFLYRGVNLGFSGGEKKKNEILQLLLLKPRLAILDELDSGLDLDALKLVVRGVESYRSADNALIVVTHYPTLLELIHPDSVHIMRDGQIVAQGGMELVKTLEENGFDAFSYPFSH